MNYFQNEQTYIIPHDFCYFGYSNQNTHIIPRYFICFGYLKQVTQIHKITQTNKNNVVFHGIDRRHGRGDRGRDAGRHAGAHRMRLRPVRHCHRRVHRLRRDLPDGRSGRVRAASPRGDRSSVLAPGSVTSKTVFATIEPFESEATSPLGGWRAGRGSRRGAACLPPIVTSA